MINSPTEAIMYNGADTPDLRIDMFSKDGTQLCHIDLPRLGLVLCSGLRLTYKVKTEPIHEL
jgi:hypothetical protein